MISGRRNIALAVAGAGGRMGRRVLDAVAASDDMSVVAAWVPEGSLLRGQRPDAASPLVFSAIGELETLVDVVVDFSRADAFDAVLAFCLERAIPLVSGTTGLDGAQQAAIDAAARRIPVLWAANYSPGVAILLRAAEEAARLLGDWDVDIAEAHHAGKRDAPSGTALALGRAIAQGRGHGFDDRAVFDRIQSGRPRESGSIGFAVTRAGDIVGEHTVLLAATGERIELTHRATDRGIFARGALQAARWLVERTPGRYRFDESLA